MGGQSCDFIQTFNSNYTPKEREHLQYGLTKIFLCEKPESKLSDKNNTKVFGLGKYI